MTAYDLILNAADGLLQIVILRDEALVLAYESFLERRATEVLATTLQSLCRDCDIPSAAFRRIACVNGPGSFTGIRLVLTTASALRRCHHSLLGAINGLSVLAWEAASLLALPANALIHVVTHARRNLLHTQSFRLAPDGTPCALAAIALLPPEEVISTFSPGDTVCGGGIARYEELFLPLRSKGISLLPGLIHPQARSLVRACAHIDYASRDLEPAYVRACDALENLERLATRQGMDGDWAQDRLHTLLTAKPHSSL